MRKFLGFGCIAMGFLCLLIAVGFVFYNKYEETQGGKTSEILLQDLQVSIQEVNQTEAAPEDIPANSPSVTANS